MSPSYPPVAEPATPEFVLAVLRDEHRQQCQYDHDADPSVVLSFETTIDQWREACDLLGWRAIARAFNETWGLSCSDAEWYDVLEPARQRCLGDLCRMVAAHTSRPAIRPAHLLGTTCVSSGMFLTIRSMLKDAGVPPDEIRPSTLLAPYTRTYPRVFLGPISRLAPGALPPVRIRSSKACTSGLAGFIAGWLLLAAGQYLTMYVLALVALALTASSLVLMWYAAKNVPPASVEFGDLRTFRDLVRVLREASS